MIEFKDSANTGFEYMMIPTDCENDSESMHLSEPDIKLNLIVSTKFPETELKSVKILKFEPEPEPKLKNLFESFSQLGRVKVTSTLYFLPCIFLEELELRSLSRGLRQDGMRKEGIRPL